jgi:hypothetical protein
VKFFTDIKFDSPLDMLDAINEVVERNIHENFEQTSGGRVGLDLRVGPLYINTQDRVIASNNQRALEYYGGFEYCDKAMVQTVGNWTFYQGDRVDDCCDRFEGREKVEYMDEEE